MAKTNSQVLDMPPFPRLEWDGYSWMGQIVLKAWEGFQSRMGAYGAMSSVEASDGTVRLCVESPTGKPDASPSAEQAAAYQFLVDHEEKIRDVILQMTFREYQDFRSSDDYDEEEFEEPLPIIDRPEQLKLLMGLSNVHVLCIEKDEIAYTGLEFGCAWEVEHGFGVMTHKDRVVKVGGADTSFIGWIAKQDAES